jgi:hypothetical protein
MSRLILRFNTVFFVLWIVLTLFGFYKYCKKTDFKNISVLHFITLSASMIIFGFITALIALDIAFLVVLFLVPPTLNIKLIKYAVINHPVICSSLLVIACILYFVLKKISNNMVFNSILISYLLGLFALGGTAFLKIVPSLCF